MDHHPAQERQKAGKIFLRWELRMLSHVRILPQTFIITNARAFWELSNYLVIQIN